MYLTHFTTPGLSRFVAAIDAERQAQLAKWGDQRHPDGTDTDHQILERIPAALAAHDAREICQRNAEAGTVTWKDIFLEEACEALVESDPAQLRAELIQAGAVIAAWIRDLDTRPHSMICAHCGDQIPTSDSRWTWSAPLCPPGVPENLAPRFHIGRPECQAACDALSTTRGAR
ncbi:hypothetical protein [Streptomyces sp. NPDC096153]|uniref:hypothetical protein n=1 Tax=Streptomyces sp. NPDC096153 TaxID=3155548 RepID=UPI00332283C3